MPTLTGSQSLCVYTNRPVLLQKTASINTGFVFSYEFNASLYKNGGFSFASYLNDSFRFRMRYLFKSYIFQFNSTENNHPWRGRFKLIQSCFFLFSFIKILKWGSYICSTLNCSTCYSGRRLF